MSVTRNHTPVQQSHFKSFRPHVIERRLRLIQLLIPRLALLSDFWVWPSLCEISLLLVVYFFCCITNIVNQCAANRIFNIYVLNIIQWVPHLLHVLIKKNIPDLSNGVLGGGNCCFQVWQMSLFRILQICIRQSWLPEPLWENFTDSLKWQGISWEQMSHREGYMWYKCATSLSDSTGLVKWRLFPCHSVL